MHEAAAIVKDLDLDDYLDVFGQQPNINIYTQICLCFPLGDDFSDSRVINTLTVGLERLTASFPWLAGQVVNEGSCRGNSGVFKIKSLAHRPCLVVKDLRNAPSMPTMDALRRAKFPFRMLDETIVAPCKTIPGGSDESTSDSKPVFLVQANFVTGGLLLTFVGQHQAMDMPGQGQVMRLFSKACRNEPFTSEELSSGNLPRGNLIPLLDDAYEQGPELAHQIVKPIPPHPDSNSSNDQAEPPSSPKCTWRYFSFHSTSLAALKSLATKTMTLPLGYISTDDALSAFIWQSVTRARLARLDPKTESTFARAINARRYLDIPKLYPGLVQNMTYHTRTFATLASAPLGDIASQLRSALDQKTTNLGYITRALATFLSRTPDKSIISVVAALDLSTDMMLSSWANIDCYDLDFNLGLGKPEAVRRPQFVPCESLVYFMPRTLDGEIAVGICLRDEDMEILKADSEFTKYGDFIG
ncbi:trichothecene 3-O-acetyltransferase-like protein [Usnea florida]